MAKTIIPLIPKWVRPNHITILRFIATPFVLWLLVVGNYAWGLPVFILVSFTDALDGSLARLRKQITEWGTLYDPVADKILIGGALILIVIEHINVYFGVLILAVEAITVVGACIQKARGKKPSANVYGKTKMFLEIVAVGFLLIALWSGISLFVPFSIGTFALAIVFAVISLFTHGI